MKKKTKVRTLGRRKLNTKSKQHASIKRRPINLKKFSAPIQPYVVTPNVLSGRWYRRMPVL